MDQNERSKCCNVKNLKVWMNSERKWRQIKRTCVLDLGFSIWIGLNSDLVVWQFDTSLEVVVVVGTYSRGGLVSRVFNDWISDKLMSENIKWRRIIIAHVKLSLLSFLVFPEFGVPVGWLFWAVWLRFYGWLRPYSVVDRM